MIKKKNFINKKIVKKKRILNTTKTTFFKVKKKWRFWRLFKKNFINKKKVNFFKKLKSIFEDKRVIFHQLIKSYLPKIKFLLKKNMKKTKFFLFMIQLEQRLSVLLVRARFFYKITNSYTAIKNNLIIVNGIIINKINFLVHLQDLFQKKRKKNGKKKDRRFVRLKWRKYRWKKARYIFWKIRRSSHFNLYWNRKQNSFFNYLEINYKIPAAILIKQPYVKEILINKQKNILTIHILKKIYFLY